MKPKSKFYIAYGSNLNLEQMAHRCPTAEVVGAATLRGWRLWFRGGNGGAVATVERERGCEVPVLVWRLQPNDEHNLDLYEGYPSFYRKETLRISVSGKRMSAMVYIMNAPYREHLASPSRLYLEGILEGCRDNGIPEKPVRDAVGRAKKETTKKKQQHRRAER